MKKKLASILLALCLAVALALTTTLLSTTALAEDLIPEPASTNTPGGGETPTPEPTGPATSVIVGGVTLDGTTDKTYATTDSAGVVALVTGNSSPTDYNVKFKDGTLTLKGATIAGVTQDKINAGIYAKGELVLVLEDSNSVYSTENTVKNSGIYIDTPAGSVPSGRLTIKGNGDLNASAKDGGNAFHCGIFVNGSLTIESGTITAEGKAADGTYNSFGVSVNTDFVMTGGTLIANGGNVTGTFSYGVTANNTVTISGGTVTATGGTSTGSSFGISSSTININPSTTSEVKVTAGTTSETDNTHRAFNIQPTIGDAVYSWKTSVGEAPPTLSLEAAYDYTDKTYTELTLGKTDDGKSALGSVTYGKANGKWVKDVTSTGLWLDIDTPTENTTYTAGSGTILWEPTVGRDENERLTVTGGTLTFDGANINAKPTGGDATAVMLPNSAPTNVIFKGRNTISAIASTGSAITFNASADTTFTAQAGSETTLTAKGENTRGIAIKNAYNSTTIAGSGKLIIISDGNGSVNIDSSGNAVNLTGGTLDFIGKVDGSVTLGSITIPETKTLDLSDANSVTKGTAGAVNNGTIKLPASFDTLEEFKALNITGTGRIEVEGGRAYTCTASGTLIPTIKNSLLFVAPENAGHWSSTATLAADGYTFTGNATDGYVLTLGDLVMELSDSTYPAITLPTDGEVEVKLTGNTSVSTGGFGIQFGNVGTEYPCTISGSGTLTLNCQGVALVSSQPLTISGGNITAASSNGFGVNAAKLTITGGTLTVSGSSAAFSTAPTITGFTPKATYGANALSTTSTTGPTDTIYTGNKYVKIEKYVPSSGGGAAAPTVEAPVTEGGATTITAIIKPETSGNISTATVPAKTVTEAAKAAAEAAKESGTKPVVELKIETPASATQVKASLPAESLKTVAESGASLTVTTGVGAVQLSSGVLASVAEKAGSKTVTLSVAIVDPKNLSSEQQGTLGSTENTVVLDLTLSAGDEKISELGGTVSVSVPYTPAAGEKTETLKVWFLADDGTISPCEGSYDAKTKSFIFKTNHFSAYVLAQFPFTDVSESAWYYGNTVYAYLSKLFSGTSDTTFAPETAMSRAMLVTVLWRMEGQPVVNYLLPFTDVDEGAWYGEAVRWAASEKLVSGVSETSFAPDTVITREQLASILFRYAQKKGADVSVGENTNILSYTDAESVSGYAVPAMQWACGAGLVNGSDGALMPQGSATRAQVAAILQRYKQQ